MLRSYATCLNTPKIISDKFHWCKNNFDGLKCSIRKSSFKEIAVTNFPMWWCPVFFFLKSYFFHKKKTISTFSSPNERNPGRAEQEVRRTVCPGRKDWRWPADKTGAQCVKLRTRTSRSWFVLLAFMIITPSPTRHQPGFCWEHQQPEVGGNKVQILHYWTWVDFSGICTFIFYFSDNFLTFTPCMCTQISLLSISTLEKHAGSFLCLKYRNLNSAVAVFANTSGCYF